MARPQKIGLDYFPMPVNLFQMDELHFVIAKHGAMAKAVITDLLMSLFEVGYCFRWGEKDQIIFASKKNYDVCGVITIVNDAINEGFFDANLYKCHQILSSKWIQERFVGATEKRRTVEFKKAFLLFTPKNANVRVIGEETPINDPHAERKPTLSTEESTQSKVKESKVKESKLDLSTEVYFFQSEKINLSKQQFDSLAMNHCNGDEEKLLQHLNVANNSLLARGIEAPADPAAYMRNWIFRSGTFNTEKKSANAISDWKKLGEK